MHIKEMLSQNRRDFRAILECEHCNETTRLNTGYDDANYHNNVIPNMTCESCGEKAGGKVAPATPKYSANTVI